DLEESAHARENAERDMHQVLHESTASRPCHCHCGTTTRALVVSWVAQARQPPRCSAARATEPQIPDSRPHAPQTALVLAPLPGIDLPARTPLAQRRHLRRAGCYWARAESFPWTPLIWFR